MGIDYYRGELKTDAWNGTDKCAFLGARPGLIVGELVPTFPPGDLGIEYRRVRVVLDTKTLQYSVYTLDASVIKVILWSFGAFLFLTSLYLENGWS